MVSCSTSADAAVDVLEAWQRALPDLDDDLAPSLVISAPGDPARPPAVGVFGAAPAVDHLIGHLRVRPGSDERRHGSHRATKRRLAGDDEPGTGHAHLHSEFFRSTVPTTALLARLTADREPGEERELDFSPWAAGTTGCPRAPPRSRTGTPGSCSSRPPRWRPARRLAGGVARPHPPHGTGGSYPSFPEQGLVDEACYLGNTGKRRRTWACYDPDGLFAGPPTSGS